MHPKIKRMVNKMEADEASGKRESGDAWFLYILRCQGNTFYTGVTKDLDRYLKMHNAGTASKYTRARRPVEMIYHEDCASHTTALVREYKVKALSRKEKEQLISGRKKFSRKGNKNG